MNILLFPICLSIFFSAVAAQFYQWENRNFDGRKIRSSSVPKRRQEEYRILQNFPVLALEHTLQHSAVDSEEPGKNRHRGLNIGSFGSNSGFRENGRNEFRKKGAFQGVESIEVVALKRGLEEFEKVKRLDSIKEGNMGEIEPLMSLLLKKSLGGSKASTPDGEDGGNSSSSKPVSGKGVALKKPKEEKMKFGDLKTFQQLTTKGSGAGGIDFSSLKSLGALLPKAGLGGGEEWKRGIEGLGSLSAFQPSGSMKGNAGEVAKMSPFVMTMKGVSDFGKMGGKKKNPIGLGQISSLALKDDIGKKAIGSLSDIKKIESIKGSSMKSLTEFGGESLLKIFGDQLANRGILNHAIIIKSYPILSHDWW